MTILNEEIQAFGRSLQDESWRNENDLWVSYEIALHWLFKQHINGRD